MFHKYNSGQWSLERATLRNMEVSGINKARPDLVPPRKEAPPPKEPPRAVDPVPQSKTPHRVDKLV